MWVVDVPATLSNLGPGFDVLGMALDLGNRFRFRAAGPPGAWTEDGVGADSAVCLALRAAEEAFDHALDHGVEVTQEEVVPRSRGLGSSATARVAGVLAWCHFSGLRPPLDELLDLLTGLEGHGDNVTAALLGGVTAVTRGPSGSQHLRLDPPAGLQVALCVPEVEVSTARARQALPGSYSQGDVVETLGALAFLMHGLHTGDVAALRAGARDRVHQPYRAPLIGPVDAALAAAQRAGAATAFISGSGSTLAALVTPDVDAEAVAAALAGPFAARGLGARAWVVQPALEGAWARFGRATGPLRG